MIINIIQVDIGLKFSFLYVVFNALNALSQLAQKGLQNKLLSSLQKVTETPEYGYEFSPRMAPTTNLANNVNAAAAVQ